MTSKHRPWALVQVPPSTRIRVFPWSQRFRPQSVEWGTACLRRLAVCDLRKCAVSGGRTAVPHPSFRVSEVAGQGACFRAGCRRASNCKYPLVGRCALRRLSAGPGSASRRPRSPCLMRSLLTTAWAKPRLVAAMVEIEASKAENDRLRSFLGLDRAARNGSFGTSRSPPRLDWSPAEQARVRIKWAYLSTLSTRWRTVLLSNSELRYAQPGPEVGRYQAVGLKRSVADRLPNPARRGRRVRHATSMNLVVDGS